jgi:CMP-N-acetylneuraminic acid synthetase
MHWIGWKSVSDMNNNPTFFSIIPARGGSKRLPNKNILPLAGKPLICYTVEASLQTNRIQKTIVTTDSDQIINTIKNYDVDIIRRPDYLATDIATTNNVILHALSALQKRPDFIVLLQPTSPLRNSRHIDDAIDLLLSKNADAVVSVCEMDHSPLWANTLPEDLSMANFLHDDIKNKRSQDLPTYYRINGAIYIVNTNRFIREQTLFLSDNIFAYIMPQETSIDIDDYFDLMLVETILKKG